MSSIHSTPKLMMLTGVFFLAVGLAVAGAQGVTVTGVASGSPAAAAGLVAGDVVLSVNGTSLDAQHQLADIINLMKIGDSVTLSVQAPGQTQAKDMIMNVGRVWAKNIPWLGLDVSAAGGAAASTAMVPDTGALVASVEPYSPASMAGLAPGDVILSMNGTALDPQHQLADMIHLAPVGQTVSLTVQAPGQAQPSVVNLNVARKSFGSGSSWIGLDAYQNAGAVNLPATGVLVESVTVGSPAAIVGLTDGDILLSVDGTTVDAQHPLSDLVASKGDGDTVTLSVIEPGDSQPRDIRVIITRSSPENVTPWLGVNTALAGPAPAEAM